VLVRYPPPRRWFSFSPNLSLSPRPIMSASPHPPFSTMQCSPSTRPRPARCSS
jgi:hypothetical protein